MTAVEEVGRLKYVEATKVDLKFTYNLDGLMMMIVENIPWNISVLNVILIRNK